MARQNINIGTVANDGTGDSLRVSFNKINQNFVEVYSSIGSAFSGSYNDLTNKPTLFSGSYNDLTNKPTLFSGDYDDLTNKPTLFSGDYDDLTNKPVNISSFTNDSGYITSSIGDDFIPTTDNAYDLGSPTNQWRSLYVSANTIFIGGTPISVDAGGNLLVSGITNSTSEENLRVESGKISLNSSKSDSLYADTGGSYTSASWSGNNIDFTAVDDIYLETLLERFFDHFDGSGLPWNVGYSNITVRINDTQTLTVTGAEDLGGGDWRVTVAETPDSDPTAVTSAEFLYDFLSTLEFDRDNNSYAIALDDSNFRVNTRRDIRLESGDDIYIDGRSNMRLRNYSRTSGITIETDFNDGDYEWLFDENGMLTTPGDITVAGDITGTASASTLVLGAEPNSNTYIQLNDNVDSVISTVANLEIITDASNTPKTWTFDTSGGLTFPDSTTQTTAYPGFDQDLNSTDSPNFVNIGLAGITPPGNTTPYATIGIAENSDLYISLSTTEIGSKVFEFGSDGRLIVPGTLYVDGNVYGGAGDRLYLAGDIGEGVPAINIPNSTEGATSPLSINNTQGGGVQIETGAGNWLFDDARLLYFPTSSDDEYNIGESVDGFNVRSDATFGIVTDASNTAYTWTFNTDGTLTFPDSTSQSTAFTLSPTLNVLKIDDGVHEKFQPLADAANTVTHDCSEGHIFYHTSPDDDWTVNLTNLNLASGYATTVTIVIVQGGTGYYPSALEIGGSAQTINWQGNSTPTPSTNRTDVVSFSIINNSGTYTVLGQLTGF